MFYRPSLKALAGLATAFALTSPALAANTAWPSKPIRIIVPYAAGGIGDITARMIAGPMEKELGVPVVVENKVGVSGSLGTDYVARSDPDGYTLLLALAAPQTLNQYIYKSVKYDGVKDFEPITQVNSNPMALLVNAKLPVKSVRDLIALAKAKPGTLNFSGAGGLTQFGGEIFKYQAKVDMVSVLYKGGAPAATAVASGEVQLTFANYSDALTWKDSGKVRLIALTGKHRFAQSPDVPTVSESGLPGFEVESWSGLLAPAGTPKDRVQKVATALQKILHSPQMQKDMSGVGAEAIGNTPEQFHDVIVAESAKWKSLIEKTGIQVSE
jgi:tripartite-type tricarboxylate transporter receptor subunit TctC